MTICNLVIDSLYQNVFSMLFPTVYLGTLAISESAYFSSDGSIFWKLPFLILTFIQKQRYILLNEEKEVFVVMK